MESMESRLLNAFHDDHYEGSFATFETESNYWSTGNDTLGLQLTEALDGILPLSPPEHKPIFESDMDHKYSLRLEEIDCGQSTCMTDNWKHDSIYSHYLEEDTSRNSSSPSIEIISVDPNCDFDSPISISEDEYDEDDDCQSSGRCSRSTRTLSSSIADYESHTSDDSEFEIETEYVDDKIKQEPCDVFQEVCTYPTNADICLKLEEEEFDNSALLIEPNQANFIPLEGRKSDGLSCFEADIVDMRDFDLAAFITQDDYDIAMNSRQPKTFFPKPSKYIEPSNEGVDSESEIIVDVETVENDNEMLIRKNTVITESNDLNNSFTAQIEDDPIKDPSWSPAPKNGKGQKSQKPRTRNSNKNNAGVNNNKTNSVSKLKSIMASQLPLINVHKTPVKPKTVGLGRGKNISMCSKPETDTSTDSDECSDNQGEGNAEESTEPPIKIEVKSPLHTVKSSPKKNIPQKKLSNPVPKRAIQVEIQGNQLVEVQSKEKTISKQCISNSIPFLEASKTENRNKIDIPIKKENIAENSHCNGSELHVKTESIVNLVAPPPKKKLNLEEYKKRRGENILLSSGSKVPTSYNAATTCQSRTYQIKLEEPKKAEDVLTIPSQPIQSEQPKRNSMKVEICQVKVEKVCGIKPTKLQKQFYDPIIEAKNKVLRLQELKKAARTKLIDSTVSAKVGPVTEILPLEEIVKGSISAKMENNKAMICNSAYEEIIILSVGSNTEIRIPPLVKIEDFVKNKSCTSVKLLQPNTLIYDISNTLHKAKTSENVKISSNSLISSIQETVLKKATPTSLKSNMQTLPTSPNIAGSPPGQCSPKKPEMSQTDICNAAKSPQQNSVPEHGEDKIIMHLRKDRIRPKTRTISIQTDMLPQFPPLELIISTMSNGDKTTSRKERTRRRRYRSRRISCSSDEDTSRSRSRSRKHTEKRRRLSSTRSRKDSYRSRSISKSGPPSTEQSEIRSRRRQCSLSGSECSYISDSSTSSYSSRNSDKSDYSSKSKSRSRSRSRSSSLCRSRSRSDSRSRFHSSRQCSATPSYQRRVSPAVEERRIVYVGRIEQDTTKEDLKKKFASYGPIRQITIHYKDTGMKYGFVTYEKAQDAYTAIDNGMRDQNINMYDISFGGRRAFCQASYSDLDGAATGPMQVCSYSAVMKKPPAAKTSFEDLLNEMKKRLSGAKGAGTSRVKS